ncbi:hypothetical protein Tco_1034161 [Tanacetum coccineum]
MGGRCNWQWRKQGDGLLYPMIMVLEEDGGDKSYERERYDVVVRIFIKKDKNEAKYEQNRARDWKECNKSKPKTYPSSADQPGPLNGPGLRLKIGEGLKALDYSPLPYIKRPAHTEMEV